MTFSLFGQKKSKGTLGIDIGTSSIKVVELEKRGGRFSLSSYGVFELTGTNSEQKKDNYWQSILKMPDNEIADGIKEIKKRARMESFNVVASVSSFSTFATVIEMPYISNDDLARAIPFEAKKYIPIPLEEVVLDWSIVGVLDGDKNKGTYDKPANIEVFLAAIPRNEVNRYQNIMKRAGLQLKGLEFENSAIIRSLLGNDLSPIVIVNIGGRSTSIIIVNKGVERVSHNYEVGGFEITRAISNSLNVSLEKAEDLKKKFGLKNTDDNIISESMISLIDMMIFETKKTITNYEESKKEKITNIVLVGGLTNMTGFGEYFKKKLGRNVVTGSPFSRIAYVRDLDPIVPELSSLFSIAIGLAMREI